MTRKTQKEKIEGQGRKREERRGKENNNNFKSAKKEDKKGDQILVGREHTCDHLANSGMISVL